MNASDYKAVEPKLTGGSRRRRGEDVAMARKGRKSRKQQSRKTGGKSRRTGRKTGKRQH